MEQDVQEKPYQRKDNEIVVPRKRNFFYAASVESQTDSHGCQDGKYGRQRVHLPWGLAHDWCCRGKLEAEFAVKTGIKQETMVKEKLRTFRGRKI